jgi:hypothetical protein
MNKKVIKIYFEQHRRNHDAWYGIGYPFDRIRHCIRKLSYIFQYIFPSISPLGLTGAAAFIDIGDASSEHCFPCRHLITMVLTVYMDRFYFNFKLIRNNLQTDMQHIAESSR